MLSYLVNEEDELYKWIRDIPAPKKQKEANLGPLDFTKIVLQTNFVDEDGNRHLITLNNDLTLDQVKRYLYEFIDLKNEVKSMLLLYKLIDPGQSLYRKNPQEDVDMKEDL